MMLITPSTGTPDRLGYKMNKPTLFSLYSQGWEKNGLFEFYKAKLKYIKEKEKTLQVVEREQSPPPSPEMCGTADDEEVAKWIKSPSKNSPSRRSRSRSPRGRAKSRSRSRSPFRRRYFNLSYLML